MDLRFEDLFLTCAKCLGEGMLAEGGVPATTMSVESTSSLTTCPKCKGTGGTTTPTGMAIQQFLQHLRRRGEL
jgi:hypothetical protein